MTNKQLSMAGNGIDDALIRGVRDYRKRAHVTQALMAELCGVHPKTISRLERHEPLAEDTRSRVREYLANAPVWQVLRPAPKRPPNVYLTQKLLTWATITKQPTESVEAVRALKEAYERAKRDEGLASIPLIQLEVENALSLATRGAYYRKLRS